MIRKNMFLLVCQFAFGLNLIAQQVNIEGQWKGKIIRYGKEWTTVVSIYREDNEIKGEFDLPDYGLHHLVLAKVTVNDSLVSCTYKDRNSSALFQGTLRGETLSGSWEGLGMKAVFELEKKADIPIRIRTEEVTFTNADAKLAGTLVLPTGKGPSPAVIQVHGSGNQTRSEDFYKSRAYLFAQNGIAVLNFDRRGKGASTGVAVSMELLADDAIAGVHFLQTNDNIEKSKIGIMGFSQGGYVGPLAASRSADIAFIIAGSAPGVTPDEQNDFDVKNALRNKKLTEDSIAFVLKFRKDLRNYQYHGSGDKSALDKTLALIRSRSWYGSTLLDGEGTDPAESGVKEWLSFDPLPVWEKVSVPKLLVWGELDNVVPVQKSKELIESVLKKSSDNYTIKIYKNASHGIAVVNRRNDAWDWPRLAAGYHQLLIAWTKQTVSNIH